MTATTRTRLSPGQRRTQLLDLGVRLLATRSIDVDVMITVDTGPEAIAGSTRMKAGTAQKQVLTAFSTAVMVKLGRTYLANAWWVSTLPGVAILLTVIAVNWLGDWLRDELDPRKMSPQD